MPPTSDAGLLPSSVIAALLALALAAFATEKPADLASRKLAATGSISVKAVDPEVEVGAFGGQVATTLGQPALRLADGSWVYPNFEVSRSDATGTLLVRFTDDRVSELQLFAPDVFIALQEAAKRSS